MSTTLDSTQERTAEVGGRAPSYPTLDDGSLSDITVALESWERGEDGALDRLMPLVVERLRRIAGHYFKGEAPQTLQPTALVNELYLHLRSRRRVDWRDRRQFLGYCGEVMRRFLIDRARARLAAKRDRKKTVALDAVIDEGVIDQAAFAEDLRQGDRALVDLDEALAELATLDPRQGRVVELRYFLGLTEAEIGEVLGVSERTVRRDWQTARLWLRHHLDRTR